MTLYEVLKVNRSAKSSEIYEAYLRRKAELESVGQPTLSAEEKRKQLSDIEYAKKVLTDPAQRAEYDRGLTADESMNNTVPPRTAHRVSLTKPQPEKAGTETEQVPETSPPERQNTGNSQDNSSPAGTSDDVSFGKYFITNAIAFIALVVLMIIVF